MKRQHTDDEVDDAEAPRDASTEAEGSVELAKKLSEMIRHKKKLSTKRAKFIMTLDDLRSLNKSHSDIDRTEWSLPQFYVQDLQRVILHSVVGDQFHFYPRWCKIMRAGYIRSVTLITINNLSQYDYEHNASRFKKLNSALACVKTGKPNAIEFVSPFANGTSFVHEFCNVPLSRSQWMKLRDEDEFVVKRNEVTEKYRKHYAQMLKQKKKQQQQQQQDPDQPSAEQQSASTASLDRIARTSLLLSETQMAREDYPLPSDKSGMHNYAGYVNSQAKYESATDRSPLFSIDCEMCYNVDGESEIVWFAMVNENLECVYETFVKPRKRIADYLTRITGVSAKTLENVTVDLSDVQARMSQILPRDAILCGQSLNNDLHCLKMFHPYVIDTSIIYNTSGNRDGKPSLKQLAAQFLGKIIQESSHNPLVDAKCSLELVLLKLRNSLEFGDAIINGCTNIYDSGATKNKSGDVALSCAVNFDHLDLSDPFKISRFIYHTGINISQNFFNVLRDNNISSYFIDQPLNAASKTTPFTAAANRAWTGKSCNRTLAPSNEAVYGLTCEALNKHKFLWSQFNLENNPDDSTNIDRNKLKCILKYIRHINARMEDNSLLMVAFTGRCGILQSSNASADADSHEPRQDQHLDQDVRKRMLTGRCFLKFKSDEMDQLERDVSELYKQVKGTNGVDAAAAESAEKSE